ncbi:MAG: DUF4296 domain-containing protein [Flaviramulus sp.]|nr:DUF4296 domain-containing protein [Flaviramulus sp.]NNC50804.1 DUF4296 domain-containing protein [Flaviramulus sp.]
MILKRFILVTLIILMYSACARFNGPKKPKNLINKEKMVAVIIDAKLIAMANYANKKIMTDSGIDLKNYVYTKHRIDSVQFALSNDYYAFHLKDYEEIYNRVNDSLVELQTIYKDLKAKEWKDKTKREEDSIKALSKLKDTIDSDILKIKDSILKPTIKNKFEKEEILVEPISDIDFQSL